VSLAQPAAAQPNFQYLPDFLGRVYEMVLGFFRFIVPRNAEQAEGFIRILMWVLAFSLAYFSGARTLFHDNPRIAGVVAFVFATITALFVDPQTLLATGSVYALAFQIFLRAALIILAIYFAFGHLNVPGQPFISAFLQLLVLVLALTTYWLMRDVLFTFGFTVP
ncbi:MAG: hypothetical protein HY518_00305, partial [Candidatus Aenigmarchaeota archaeon]|nr:hypothetical protein [Candidatus Aenigmarchaeota archaeon]